MSKSEVCGLKIDNVCASEALEIIDNLISDNMNAYVVTPNIDHIMIRQKDGYFKLIYDEASLVLADGMPILWAAKFLKKPLKAKVSGSDLFPMLCEIAAKRGHRVFFLGGRPGVALKAAEVIKNRFPLVQIVGVYSPPFGFEHDESENAKIVGLIRDSEPDILFVGLGTPKQEKWIHRYRDVYKVPVSIGIGASFEFMAGTVRRAPYWMQRFGLEWFWRLLMEPGRLWKRYLLQDMKFIWLVLKNKLK